MKGFSISFKTRFFVLLFLLSSALVPTGWLMISAYKNELARTRLTLISASRVMSKQMSQSLLLGDTYNASLILSEVCDELKLVSCSIYDSSGAEVIHYPTVPDYIPSIKTYEQHLIYGGKSVGKIEFRYRSPELWSVLDEQVGPILGLILLLFGFAAIVTMRWANLAFNKFQEAAHEKLKSDAIVVLSKQVAHDIGSPLAALEMVVSLTKLLPEFERQLIRTSVNRIRDISNTLRMKDQANFTSSQIDETLMPSEPFSIQLASSLVDLQITEKRLEIRNLSNIVVHNEISEKSYGLFVKVQVAEFKRVISNILNNAIDASHFGGQVIVRLTRNGSSAEIEIKDFGKGISKEVMSKLCVRGGTFGKRGGSGLGLWHASKMVEAWGGSLSIFSEVGEGTSVKILLPQIQAPSWFVPFIELDHDRRSKIVILDDDETIHEIWKERFRQVNLPENKQVHLMNAKDFKFFLENNDQKNCIFLMDDELIGESQRGSDLIENAKISQKSILVTSRFEEEDLREKCEKIGLRMVPKISAPFVPIKFKA